jgi:hypothetical protein
MVGSRKLSNHILILCSKMCLMNRQGENVDQAEASGKWVRPPDTHTPPPPLITSSFHPSAVSMVLFQSTQSLDAKKQSAESSSFVPSALISERSYYFVKFFHLFLSLSSSSSSSPEREILFLSSRVTAVCAKGALAHCGNCMQVCPCCRVRCGDGCDGCCNCGPCRKKVNLYCPCPEISRTIDLT